MEIEEMRGKLSCQTRREIAKQELLLLEWQSNYRIRCFIRVVPPKQFGCSVPVTLGTRWVPLNATNSWMRSPRSRGEAS
jgi:hypothetical protein